MQTHKGTHEFKVADLFCGAGGSSTGARKAIEKIGGKMDLVAINHWNMAIATHSANHPTARHVIEDVSIVDPESVVKDGYLDILMASPECTYHSRARGGKPIHDQGRMNPWAVMNWLTKLDVQHVLIENVPEYVDWGPLGPDFKPVKSRKGEHFQAWFLNFHSLGYYAEWRILNAADYGDATTRTRFFLLARKDGRPIQWPEPSHAKGDTGMFPGRSRWRGAREIIDWSNPGRSLLDDPKYVKKPLSEKTRRRIARGLERFGGPLAPLYIRLLDIPEYAPDSVDGKIDQGFIVNRHGENGNARVHSVDEPMPTATCRGAGYLVHPEAEPFIQANRNHTAPKGMYEPVPAVTSAHGGGSFIVEPELQAFMLGQQSGGAPRSTDDPAPTVTTDGAISLVQPSIIEYYGDIRVRGVDSPLPVITQRTKHALINPTLIRYNGQSKNGEDVDDPLSTITAQAQKHGLVNPMLVEYYGTSTVSDIDQPVPTVTTKARHGLASPSLIEVNHGNGAQGLAGEEGRGHSVDDPLVSPMMEQAVLEQIEAADIDPRRVVFVNGYPHLLDIRFRMLQNPELARAMGFEDEETSYEFVGTVAEVTKQIGNAVPVHMAAALVSAALS